MNAVLSLLLPSEGNFYIQRIPDDERNMFVMTDRRNTFLLKNESFCVESDKY